MRLENNRVINKHSDLLTHRRDFANMKFVQNINPENLIMVLNVNKSQILCYFIFILFKDM